MNRDTIIVGGGLSGLACAQTLHRAKHPFQLLEKSDRIGGRVQTDSVNGFQLDRGFQVLLTSYPSAKRCLNYEDLSLGTFNAGAKIFTDGVFHTLGDPRRHPSTLFQSLNNPFTRMSDQLKLGLLHLNLGPQASSRQSSEAYFKQVGFSDAFINSFLRPFFGGVFLDNDLSTTSDNFAFTFSHFTSGRAAIPAGGMSKIPEQMAASLPPSQIKMNKEVSELSSDFVRLNTGEKLAFDTLVVATPFDVAADLLNAQTERLWNATTCMYFACDTPPVEHKFLMLNGEQNGYVNLVVIPSLVTQNLAPNGRHLICVSLKSGLVASPENIKSELQRWFGSTSQTWQHLKTYQIPQGLPAATPETKKDKFSEKLPANTFICGDHTGLSSIEQALKSGREAAQTILARR